MKSSEAEASADQPCFLCQPDRYLTVDLPGGMAPDFVLVAGLGPLVLGYFVLASRDHVPSMADLDAEKDYFDQVERIRDHLLSTFDSILLTEHGRVPVCRDEKSRHEAHCYHAHFLGFPNAPDITHHLQSYFASVVHSDSMGNALQSASNFENYALVSPASDNVSVFGNALSFPRQLLRYLVAHELGNDWRTDWKANPMREEAVSNASLLQRIFK